MEAIKKEPFIGVEHPGGLLTGQVELLRRKRQNLESRLAVWDKEAGFTQETLLGQQQTVAVAQAALALLSSVISRQVSSSFACSTMT